MPQIYHAPAPSQKRRRYLNKLVREYITFHKHTYSKHTTHIINTTKNITYKHIQKYSHKKDHKILKIILINNSTTWYTMNEII